MVRNYSDLLDPYLMVCLCGIHTSAQQLRGKEEQMEWMLSLCALCSELEEQLL